MIFVSADSYLVLNHVVFFFFFLLIVGATCYSKLCL